MTLLIPLLLRLTTWFERGEPAKEMVTEVEVFSDDTKDNSLEKE